ncbi:hypothetical protein FEM48_Zijuj10G0158100 [Ziziphus jujuba var. spinosa]|uniref:Phospholipase A1 n=1 Tax=Ziziphus jujuba var. spinosa TaxID=714518 RepID=A0A978UPA3_ZIZJJ|nr:hypothetical protein FEM48_Zijuj10G0158100 [Ziziphus jujuba var. spinosa]
MMYMAARKPAKVITWRDLIGVKDWKGLLNPLKPELGHELSHYCNLIRVIENSFQSKKDSPLLGLPQHNENELLTIADLSNHYVVEKYLYASTKNIRPEQGHDDYPLGQKSGYSNWIGYTSRKHGSRDGPSWVGGQIPIGENLSIVVTGFSMGGAFATLIATDLVYNGYNKADGRENAIPVTAFAFANSPLGNKGFYNVASKLDDLHILLVKHESDVNPDNPTQKDDYYHVGEKLIVEMGVHDLDVYSLAITQSQQVDQTSLASMCPAK